MYSDQKEVWVPSFCAVPAKLFTFELGPQYQGWPSVLIFIGTVALSTCPIPMGLDVEDRPPCPCVPVPLSQCGSLGLGLHYVHNATCTRRDQDSMGLVHWYGGWFSRLGPMGLRQGLCHIRMKCTVFHYQLVLVTFCYQLAKISMIFLIFFFISWSHSTYGTC